MRSKAVVLGIAIVMLSGLTTTSAWANRVAEGTYASPAVGAAGLGVAGCATSDATGCVILAGGPERFVSVKLEDDSGQKAAGSVTQDLDGDQQSDTGTDFCGETTEPVAIEPNLEVNVFIFSGPCTDGTPAAATSGKVIGTFTDGASGGGGGTTLASPKAKLRFSDQTPKFGKTITATAWLGVCGDHAGTKIQLQRKVKGSFTKVASKTMSSTCRASFQIKATFKEATFRSFWPKQDDDHRAGKGRPGTVTTHR